MATSEVSICNLALQKLGATRITSLTEDSRNARSCNACYEALRDGELRAHSWKFAIKRVVLAPSVTAPVFDYTYAFPLPSACLRVLFPPRLDLDWVIEDHLGAPAILTNDGDALNVRYLARVTDPTLYDTNFVIAVAMRMTAFMGEELTQSNTKEVAAMTAYNLAIKEARRMNAFETVPDVMPLDAWDAARRRGSVQRNDLKGPWPGW